MARAPPGAAARGARRTSRAGPIPRHDAPRIGSPGIPGPPDAASIDYRRSARPVEKATGLRAAAAVGFEARLATSGDRTPAPAPVAARPRGPSRGGVWARPVGPAH